MSLDIKIQNLCDHTINWERSQLDTDRVTIRVNSPIASVSSLSLRMNNIVQSRDRYMVVTSVTDLVIEPPMFIKMLSKVRDYDPIVECQYNTLPNYCPKCRGVKVLDDLVYTNAGDFRTVTKEANLIQDVEKCVITKVESNAFHSWYGTGLSALIGTKIMDFDLIRIKISDQITSSIDRLRQIQNQLVSSGRDVDAGELFGQLMSLTVEQTEDPTLVMVTVVFTAQSGKTLEYSQFLELSYLRQRVSFTAVSS